MLEQVLKYLRNYFEKSEDYGVFKIENGSLDLPNALNGQYVRIIGSVFNDGVYQYSMADLQDEEFEGCIQYLAIPKSLLRLVEEIEAFNAKNESSPYTAESFGGYSYQKKTGGQGGGYSWQDEFASRLALWRKL